MDLSVFDDLLNIAEIFSVFLGFTVLVTALSRSRLNAIRVIGVVISASTGIVLCLLPILMRTFWEDANSIVQFSSVVWIAINAIVTIAMFKLVPGMKEIHAEAFVGTSLVWLFEIVMYGFLILCLFQIWADHSVAFYFAAVITLMLQAIMMFVALVLSISQEQEANS